MFELPNPERNRSIRSMSLAIAIGGAVVGGAFALVGLYQFTPWSSAHGSGVFLLAAGCILMTVSLFAYCLLELTAQAEENVNRIHQIAVDLLVIARRIEPHFKTIADNVRLSDTAKSLAHRELEREALRQAIHEEMYGGDAEAVQYLINEMERRFGYKQEAQKLREEVSLKREMTIEEKINEALSHIEKMMDEHRWDRAQVESDRLTKLFPRHERVSSLSAELDRRRDVRKQELLDQWKLAVQREEIDRGIAILTELDAYLTKEEAQALQDSARHVFKARLVNLGVQFGLAVTESRWRDALEVGLRIRQEFPNSRMAQEVSQKLETLQVKAGFVADADLIEQRPVPAE
ncbi:MAG: hypothetical protein KA354_06140 [Phycisphaerae bacterium]|nr:hypothetical protein [Phycisphaerae bacterium]